MFKLLILLACVGLVVAVVPKKSDDEIEMENAIFYYREMLEPKEVLRMLDELSEIYKQQGEIEDLNPADVRMREVVEVLRKIGHVAKENCENSMSTYNEMVATVSTYHVMMRATGDFVKSSQQQQQELCQQQS